LLAEAATMVDARPLVVEVDPRDLELLRTVAAAEGLDVEALPSLHSAGGLVARDQAADVLVHNTLEARLRKARGALRLDMTSTVPSEPRDTVPSEPRDTVPSEPRDTVPSEPRDTLPLGRP